MPALQIIKSPLCQFKLKSAKKVEFKKIAELEIQKSLQIFYSKNKKKHNGLSE